MAYAGRAGVLALWIVSLAVAATLGARAQQKSDAVFSGQDFGFKIQGQYNGKPYGTVVIRLNGAWVEVGAGPSRVVPAN